MVTILLNRYFLSTALLLLTLNIIAQPAETHQSIKDGQQEETSMLVIDVRTPAEWHTGHLDGAEHIEWQDIGEKIDQLTSNKHDNIYLYCRSGNRSGKAMTILKQQGYTNVINAGGIDQAQLLLERNIVSN
jgi:phage shock protein E